MRPVYAMITLVAVGLAGFAACGGSNFDAKHPPEITSVVPTSGPVAGGTVVTVTGHNFPTAISSVTFGSVPALTFTIIDSTHATVTTPPHAAGAVAVEVQTPDGGKATAPNAFTFISPPIATGIVPVSGGATGGTAFTLSGTEFATGATVSIGGAAATSVNVVSASQITGVTPAGTAGAGRDIIVVNPDGQADTLLAAFTYVVTPVVASILPVSGQNTGGVSFTITGSGFAAGATVTIGGAAATSVNVVSSTSITGLTPAGTNGARDVVVTNPGGQSHTLAGGFTFTAPAAHTITGVSRDAGSTAGGSAVTVTGTSFSPGAVVLFGATQATTTTFVSSTQLTAVAPPGPVSVVNVTVRISGADAVLNNAWEYLPAPTVFYLQQDFEGGASLSPFNTGTPANVTVTTAHARSGTHSVRCFSTNGAAALNFQYSNPTNPPAANATGLYQRWYVRVTDTTLVNVRPGQIKMFLNRHQGLVNFPWIMAGIGDQFASNQRLEVVAAADANITRLDPGGPSDSRTGFIMPANQWVEFQTWFRRENGTGVGRVRFWINGRRELDTQASILGNQDTTLLLNFSGCMAHSQGLLGPVQVYTDAYVFANGYVDPVP